MKKRFLTILTIATIAIATTSCKDKAKEVETTEAEPIAVSEVVAEKYVADTAESTIEWKGFKPTGTHNGTINIETGVFHMNNGTLESGTFLIDMTSMIATDIDGKMKDNLENHLKGTVEGKEGDFFDVTKFPTGAFEITKVVALEGNKFTLSGNLTLKDVKHNISFPVHIETQDGVMKMYAEAFTIDRTKWGINYGSKSVFDNLGDKFINDDIELKINIVANKKA